MEVRSDRCRIEVTSPAKGETALSGDAIIGIGSKKKSATREGRRYLVLLVTYLDPSIGADGWF
jgi:hypothetical protein